MGRGGGRGERGISGGKVRVRECGRDTCTVYM